MLIIGFGHRARQGKNSAAVAMINAAPIGAEVRMYAYADALRAEVKTAATLHGGYEALIAKMREAGTLPAWVTYENGKPRTLLQWWGTNYRRANDENYWVRALVRRLEQDNPDIALITDVRFPNEVDAIHAAGGYVVKVVKTTAPDVAVPSHPSEDALDGFTGWDYTIEAEDLPELRIQAAGIFHHIQESCSCRPPGTVPCADCGDGC